MENFSAFGDYGSRTTVCGQGVTAPTLVTTTGHQNVAYVRLQPTSVTYTPMGVKPNVVEPNQCFIKAQQARRRKEQN